MIEGAMLSWWVLTVPSFLFVLIDIFRTTPEATATVWREAQVKVRRALRKMDQCPAPVMMRANLTCQMDPVCRQRHWPSHCGL